MKNSNFVLIRSYTYTMYIKSNDISKIIHDLLEETFLKSIVKYTMKGT